MNLKKWIFWSVLVTFTLLAGFLAFGILNFRALARTRIQNFGALTLPLSRQDMRANSRKT